MTEITLEALSQWINTELAIDRFKDYAPNGLQVQGAPIIRTVVMGVTASQALIDEAIRLNAQAIIVHHGWFWQNENPRIIGNKHQRLAALIRHDINLLAYHLPLDAHPSLGNNAQLARVLGITPHFNNGLPVTLDPEGLVWTGHLSQPYTQQAWVDHVSLTLKRPSIFVGEPDKAIQTVAWCTGGAQGYMSYAIDADVDVYLTGEASEKNCHMARESNTAFVGAGHHATERYGIQALGVAIAKQFGIDVHFIDIDNPI